MSREDYHLIREFFLFDTRPLHHWEDSEWFFKDISLKKTLTAQQIEEANGR